MNEQNEIVLYQPNELTKLEVWVEDETVWLNVNQIPTETYQQICVLYGSQCNSPLQGYVCDFNGEPTNNRSVRKYECPRSISL